MNIVNVCLTVAVACLQPHGALGSLHASKALPQGRPSLNWDKYLLQPTFDEGNRQKVIAAAGSTAFLHCRINHLADRAVTWIRKADVQVLTVNSYTYTTDHRITAHSSSDADEWVLKITSAQIEDSGGYECQVSTETKMSLTFELEVVVAYAEISGTREVFMNSGGDLDLSCSVGRITDPPEFVLWYHGKAIINYSERPGVSVSLSKAGKTSRLLIKGAQDTDSGNYTCAPSNAVSASVLVHIVREERPAAMQHGDRGATLQTNMSTLMFCTMVVLVVYYLHQLTTTTNNVNHFTNCRKKATEQSYHNYNQHQSSYHQRIIQRNCRDNLTRCLEDGAEDETKVRHCGDYSTLDSSGLFGKSNKFLLSGTDGNLSDDGIIFRQKHKQILTSAKFNVSVTEANLTSSKFTLRV